MIGNNQVSRRTAISGMLSVPFLTLPKSALAQTDDDRFLLFIVLPQGASCTEFFDGRPTAWTTEHSILANPYLQWKPDNAEAENSKRRLGLVQAGDLNWSDPKGGRCLGRPATRPLEAIKDQITIFNGIHVDPDGDGHDRNLQHLFSVNHTSDIHYFDRINAGKYPLSFVQFGDNPFIPYFKNSGSGLRFSSIEGFDQLVQKVIRTKKMPMSPALEKYLRSQYEDVAKGRTQLPFFKGVEHLAFSLGRSQSFYQSVTRFAELQAAAGSGANSRAVDYCIEFFKSKQTNVGVVVLDEASFDTHDKTAMSEVPEHFFAAAETFAYAVQRLRSQSVGTSNLLDRTTVIMTSDFGRTLRQDGVPIAETGTDHNTVSSGLIGAGRAFRNLRGRIIGASDFQTLDEKISDAHRRFESFNRYPRKLVGMPFDHRNLSVSLGALPGEYQIQNYLHYANIFNSILFGQFGVRDLQKFADGSTPKLLDALVNA